MPNAPARCCPCGGRIQNGRCDRCGPAKTETYRPSAAKRGYNWRWRNENRDGAADYFLAEHPLCQECAWHFVLTPATIVDHKRPHKGNQELFWGTDNWQALCKRCHDQKTQREQNAMAKYVVCGPPGAGKTTWVRARAVRGDLVFDADYLLSELLQAPPHTYLEHAGPLVERLMATVVDWVLNYPDRSAYVIQADEGRATETAYKLGATLVAIDMNHCVTHKEFSR